MSVDFQRIAIVNRGEPAMRLIHAIREFNLERGTGITAIALFTEPDRRARFVREADESYNLGPATFVDDADGQRKPTYLDYERLEKALLAVQADAVMPGWGFVAERADFIELCDRLGITFIGPSSHALRRLGDKISAKRIAEQAGLLVTPWGGEAAATLDVAWAHAQRMGYPVVVKASAGAGGRGIRRAWSEAELPAAFDSARREAGRTFGDATVFVERWLEGVRHVEVQIQGDHDGAMWALGIRDCTIQRRFQKLIAEAPSPALLAREEEALKQAAIRLCRAADYQDAATVEFLFDPSTRQFFFMEVNPRLQVEHPVTELTTGVDLVKLSLHVARGGRLEGEPPTTSGHAIEVRLNAENVDAGFSASPGEIELFRLPTGPGLRVDSGVAEGDFVPPEFGSMFAKLSTVGHTREEALGRLKRALAESAVAIKGGSTNRAFLLDLLDRDEVRAARVDVGWLDRLSHRPVVGPGDHAGIALLQAAIEVYNAEAEAELEEFFSGAAKMRPTCRPDVGRQVEVGYLGHRYQFKVYRQGLHEFRIDVAGTRIDLGVERRGASERWITHGEHRYHVLSFVQGFTHLVEVDGVPHRISRADAGIVRAPGPAMVVSLSVKGGDFVAAGDRLAVLESMKMELAVTAPFSGTVRQVLVMANAQVGAGAPLVHVDPARDGDADAEGLRVTFEGISLLKARPDRRVSRTRAILRGVKAGIGELARGPAHRAPVLLENLRRLMLGFDVDPAETKRLVSEYVRTSQAMDGIDAEHRRDEDRLLQIFVDISAVFGRHTAPEAGEAGGALSAEEYLFTYLRTLEAKGGDLPRAFIDKLQQALAHYGVDSLEPTPALRESLLWMFKSRRRADQQVDAVVAILEQRLARGDAADTPGFLPLLDRLIAVARNRYQAAWDLARDVRYRAFDRPGFEQSRRAVYATMEAHLSTLARDPYGADRRARIAALVSCPQPLTQLFAPRFEPATPVVREVMLEVLARRFYRIRDLGPFASVESDDRSVVQTDYALEGRRVHLVAAHASEQDLRRALESVRAVSQSFPAGHDVIIDLHVWTRSLLDNADAASDELRVMLDQVRFERPVRRVVLMVSGPAVAAPSGHTQVLHVPPRAGRLPRAEALSRDAPDDGEAPRAVAPAQLLRQPPAVGRGRLPVPRCRPGQPEGRAVVRARRGAGRHGHPRRERPARADPASRADAAGDDDRDPAGAVPSARRKPPAVESGAALRPPAAGVPEGRARGDRAGHGRGGGGARAAEGRGAGEHARRERGTARYRAARRGRRRAGHGPAVRPGLGRADQAPDRLRAEGRADAPARPDVSLRAHQDADARGRGDAGRPAARGVRRARSRRGWPARAGRPAVRAQHRERRGGAHPERDREVPGGDDPGHHPRRSEQGGRVARRAGVRPHHRRPRHGASRCASRSSGSRSRPARRSRWRAAPRTWTGSPRCCGGSSSSRRPVTRSTSS